MSITKRHPSYHRQQIGYWAAVAGVPVLFSVPTVVYAAMTGNTTIGFGGVAAGFLATQAAGHLWDRVVRQTNCPQCGSALRQRSLARNGLGGRTCAKCDVVWELGVPGTEEG